MIIWLFILKKKYLKVLIMKRFYNGLNIWNLAGSNYELYKKKEFYEAFFIIYVNFLMKHMIFEFFKSWLI
jgi:hypothetical protein